MAQAAPADSGHSKTYSTVPSCPANHSFPANQQDKTCSCSRTTPPAPLWMLLHNALLTRQRIADAAQAAGTDSEKL